MLPLRQEALEGTGSLSCLPTENREDCQDNHGLECWQKSRIGRRYGPLKIGKSTLQPGLTLRFLLDRASESKPNELGKRECTCGGISNPPKEEDSFSEPYEVTVTLQAESVYWFVLFCFMLGARDPQQLVETEGSNPSFCRSSGFYSYSK